MSQRSDMAHQDVGKTLAELTTPVLLLDLPVALENIRRMASWVEGRVGLRPHAKTHKCVELARAQVAAGAIGITAATVFEARELLRGGIREVLIANEIVGDGKLRVLSECAQLGRVIVAADDERTVGQVAGAAQAAGSEIGVLVEVDVGMGRGGVRSTEAALRVAGCVEEHGMLSLQGVMGYEGHAVLEPDRARREQLVAAAMTTLLSHVEALRDRGYPVEIVSAGGTNTYDITGTVKGVTELQAGTYPLMDVAYAPFVPSFEPALTVLGRVIARHGGRVVLDSGSKTVAELGFAPARPRDAGLRTVRLDEEHALLDVVEGNGPGLGDVVELVVGYCGGTVNLHDAYRVVEDGVVVDAWPVIARGTGFDAAALRRPSTPTREGRAIP